MVYARRPGDRVHELIGNPRGSKMRSQIAAATTVDTTAGEKNASWRNRWNFLREVMNTARMRLNPTRSENAPR